METKSKTGTSQEDMELAEAIRNSAHQIWKAGLGAFSRAQHEGGDMFSRLVRDGEDLQKRAQGFVADRREDVTDTMTRLVESMGRQASQSWERVEQTVEERVSGVLTRLGVPTKEDIEALSRQIDKLNRNVLALSEKKKPAAKAEPKKAAATRSAPVRSRTTTKKTARQTAGHA